MGGLGLAGLGLAGLGLGGGLLEQEVGEGGAGVDQAVQDVAVELGGRAGLAGVLGWLGLGFVRGHERKKDIVGVGASRIAWVGWRRGGMGWV